MISVLSHQQVKINLYLIFFSKTKLTHYSFSLSATDDSSLLSSSKLIINYLNSQDCCSISSIEFHPESRKLIYASSLSITTINLTSCIADPTNCQTCELNGYFSYDSSFSLLSQKWTRSSWSTINNLSFFANPKFLDTGKGTSTDPYLSEMSVV